MSNSKKPYNLTLGCIESFYIPHPEADYANAQDVVYSMVSSAKNISIATWSCFKDGRELAVKGEVVADLIYELQTKLEMIERILPLAFQAEEV
ncbi:hypothetical protein B9T24_03215 [Acinetobacter sp. ANC 4654]|uniref:hypothetical protein n=1 Tax=Acinetobacter sp. ANC 4654 TaxID=1977872 RepID=UPI000A32FBDF|nr:hypothetical protein [Acinetobacter sp. ANC 4654]OTG98360.1 hypothetical protein B9T24_03215 [Acinetobacter sp. ANC 4654]